MKPHPAKARVGGIEDRPALADGSLEGYAERHGDGVSVLDPVGRVHGKVKPLAGRYLEDFRASPALFFEAYGRVVGIGGVKLLKVFFREDRAVRGVEDIDLLFAANLKQEI